MKTKTLLAVFVAMLSHSAYGDNADFAWQGFIAQGIAQASDSSFINQSGALSAELTELGVNALQVFLHRGRAGAEDVADVAVDLALDHPVQHLGFLGGEAEGAGQAGEHAGV